MYIPQIKEKKTQKNKKLHYFKEARGGPCMYLVCHCMYLPSSKLVYMYVCSKSVCMCVWTGAVFQYCPFLVRESVAQDLNALQSQWLAHKYQKPKRGAILLNADLSKVASALAYCSLVVL